MFLFIVPSLDPDTSAPATHHGFSRALLWPSSSCTPPHETESSQGQGHMCTRIHATSSKAYSRDPGYQKSCPNEPKGGPHQYLQVWQGDHACLARGTPDLCAMPVSVQNGADMGKQKGKSVPALSCRHVLSQNSEELQNSNLAHQTIIKAYLALSIVPFFLVPEIQPSPCSLSVSAQHIAVLPQTTFLSLPCS